MLFVMRYGNLLRLMEVDVPLSAITALAQFYDSPLRCFTFRDFQLAPTVEEFEHILGIQTEGKTPYRHLEHHASVSSLAAIMKVSVRELEGRLSTKSNVRGLTQGYLEQYLHYLAEKKDRETFMDVLALTLYGVMLFPKIKEFVDHAAIDVFVANRTRSETLVNAILADVYGTMSFCHEKKGKKILCCLPMLYEWLINQISKYTVGGVVQDVSKVRGNSEWA